MKRGVTVLARWWRDDRPVNWGSGWAWGWLGNGWNCLQLGRLRVWFGSGPSPAARLRRRLAREGG